MSDNDLLSIFRTEVDEYLESLNGGLLQVEMMSSSDPNYKPTVIEMNRIAHSMKGAARAVGIGVIESLAHYMEEIFNSAIQQRTELEPHICDSLYDCLDIVQSVVAGEETNDEALTQVVANLEQIIASSNEALATDSQQIPQVYPVVNVDDEDDDFEDEISTVVEGRPESQVNGEKKDKNAFDPHKTMTIERPATVVSSVDSQTIALRPYEETVRVTVSKLDRLMAEATELIVARMRGEERQREITHLRQLLTSWQREWRSVRSAYIRLVRRVQERDEKSSELPALFKFLETNQRYLVETSRRLAIIAQIMAQDGLHLTTLSETIQEEIDSMRLIPFESIVGGYQRIVRDLARDTGKSIQFDVHGAYVEIDKTVLDALKDPLMHLIRNAVDHGIETPEVRENHGKNPIGRIALSVEQRGSEIVIEIVDDGKGIDTDRVRKAIVKNKILSQTEAESLTDDEARFYIFHSGLSTSDEVTTISGRGLGMDIVRERVEGLRGRVEVDSTRGEGTRITINVPVSLTRIRCIVLQLGDEEFAVPSVVVDRMETIRRDDIFTAEGRDMIVVNDEPVPLVSLGSILKVPSTVDTGNLVHVMMLRSGNRFVGFEVDRLLNEQELVLKPLGTELLRTRFVSGAALLGTGNVIIVLDSNDLVRAASGTVLPKRKAPILTSPTVSKRRVKVLVADDSITTRTLEKNILETAGFDVRVAIDGSEAWGLLNEDDFDVVISDVEMPNMNGLELASMIKASARHQHIPVVLLTSLGKPEQREAGMRAGADAYLVKSQFDQGELLTTIQSVL